MKCPICGSELIVFYSLVPSETTGDYVETSADCPACDYSELNEVNNKVVAFGDNYWEWNDTIPANEVANIQLEILAKLSTTKPRFIYNKVRYYPVD